jgi:hypothetical protein
MITVDHTFSKRSTNALTASVQSYDEKYAD